MAHIAFLTLEDRTGYVIDDALAVDELRARGHRVDEIAWTRPAVDWTEFDLVAIRTPWDYTSRPGDFLATLAHIESRGVALENRREVVAWNLHKSYLRDLESRGATIVPTRWGRGLDRETLRALRSPEGSIVVKPVISANARDTFVIDSQNDDARLESIASLYVDREWMAQPFLRSVTEQGEYSVFYFGGVYSHAVVKVPKAGDFRVQEEHGGIIRSIEAPGDIRAAAGRVVACLDGPLLQARIDLVRLEDGRPAVMEAELIEPSLYLRTHPNAAKNFADAVESRLRR